MLPSLYFLAFLGQFTESPKPPTLDVAVVQQSGDTGAFVWEDAEDRVTGSFSPWHPREDKTVDVVVRVGNIQGPPFDGPVTLTLKPVGDRETESKTVTRNETSKAWAAQLQTRDVGEYTLEIGYTTTRHKVVKATVQVEASPLSRWPWYLMIAVGGALALGLGVRSVLKRKPGT